MIDQELFDEIHKKFNSDWMCENCDACLICFENRTENGFGQECKSSIKHADQLKKVFKKKGLKFSKIRRRTKSY